MVIHNGNKYRLLDMKGAWDALETSGEILIVCGDDAITKSGEVVIEADICLTNYKNISSLKYDWMMFVRTMHQPYTVAVFKKWQ